MKTKSNAKKRVMLQNQLEYLKRLLASLEAVQAPASQTDFCRAKIEQLQNKLETLNA